MSRNSYIIKIDNPCSENWQEMSPVGGGRFCAHCSKKVVDFSTLSDNEIIKILSRQKGNLCGRFQTVQLNKELVQSKQTRNGKGFYKYLAGLFLLGISKNAFSDNNKFLSKENIVANPVQQKNTEEASYADTLYKEVRGRVLDSATSRPIYAIIKIKETGANQVTDSLGRFVLKIPNNYRYDRISLEINSLGYKKIERALLISEIPQSSNYYIPVISDNNVLAGDVVIIKRSEHKKHWWQFWK